MQDITDFKHYLRRDITAQTFLADTRAMTPLTLARAPGRLDVMGGIADYSGSLVAEMTIAEAARVALAPRTDRILHVWSHGIEAEGLTPQVSLSLDDFYCSGSLLGYDAVHSHLRADPLTRWAAYVLGCAYVLLAEAIISDFPNGAKITGGGSGGTVAFLTYGEQAEQTIHEIADMYWQQTGRTPPINIGGQSPGAMAFGSEQI